MTAARTERPTIEWVPIEAVRENPNNPRIHSEQQIGEIAASIKANGWTQPILTDKAYMAIAGHGRLRAGKRLSCTTVPIIRLDLTTAQAKAYSIADNRLTDRSSFDLELLGLEFELILESDPEFDLDLTGFDGTAIELIRDKAVTTHDEETPVPAIVAGPAVSQIGDLWEIGPHRLLCGDATEPDNYIKILGKRQAQIVVSDPPYNLKISSIVGRGKHKQREFVSASGEMTQAEFARFLVQVVGNMTKVSRDGVLIYLFIDHRHMLEMLLAGQAAGLSLITICSWIKRTGAMGKPYRNQVEFVPVFKKGDRPHIDNIQLGKHGRNRTNAWHYAGMNTFSAERDSLLALHSTVKNCDMIADAICDASHRGGLVLDPFGGSGTTLVAAHRTGRVSSLMELDPLYCDVIIRRAALETGLSAVDAHGVTFDHRSIIAEGKS